MASVFALVDEFFY